MRCQLSLRVISQQRLLPVNYKYELSSWIYNVFFHADPVFSSWLHERGYDWAHRKFKFFTFSDLKLKKFTIQGDRIQIDHPEVEVELSFLMEESAEKFIVGLFMKQIFDLGDTKSRVRFEVVRVTSLPEPEFMPVMRFKCISPICVSEHLPDSKYAQYLEPRQSSFEKRFFDNLVSKYIALRQKMVLAGETPAEDVAAEEPELKLEVLSEPKSRLVTVKADKEDETKLRGYIFRFRVTAPVELIRIGYYAGFGEKNSLGFGCSEAEGDLKKAE